MSLWKQLQNELQRALQEAQQAAAQANEAPAAPQKKAKARPKTSALPAELPPAPRAANGRLQRVALERPELPRAISTPPATTSGSLSSAESSWQTRTDEPEEVSAPTTSNLTFNAQDFVRALVMGELFDEPKARQGQSHRR